MKKTVFFEAHVEMGGRMVPFAGYEMPVEFSGVRDEHIHVRNKVAVFDVSHMGEIWAEGPMATEFVQHVTTNDVYSLSPGKVQYSCFPNGRGGIVDDLLVYMFDKNKYLMVVNASNTEKDWNWLQENMMNGVKLRNVSDETSQLAIQGPDAEKVLQNVTDVDLKNVPSFHFVNGAIAGIKDVIISSTGYTGAGGFELYFRNEDGPAILEAIMAAGKEHDIKPAGLAARDTLRLEMGYCLYGNDIDESTSPIEAGLAWITKFNDSNDFIDRPLLEEQKKKGVSRKLTGFVLKERGIPRKDYQILNEQGESIGHVTSGTMSPYTSKAIGMGYINTPYHKEGTDILIAIRNKQIPAIVKRPPFIDQ